MAILVAKPQASTMFGLVQYPLWDIVFTALITFFNIIKYFLKRIFLDIFQPTTTPTVSFPQLSLENL